MIIPERNNLNKKNNSGQGQSVKKTNLERKNLTKDNSGQDK